MHRVITGLFAAMMFSGTLLATPASAGQFEQDLLVRINSYRATHKLKPLAASVDLDVLAREHNHTMQKADKLSHGGFKRRFERSGSNVCVENVAWNHETPLSLFNGWKDSPGHNKNMISPQVHRAGVVKTGPYVTFFACK